MARRRAVDNTLGRYIMLRVILRKLVTGALYGAGFGVALLAVLAVFLGGVSTFFAPTGTNSAVARPAPEANLDITSQLKFETRRAGVDGFGKLEIITKVENTGAPVTGYVNIYADLFQADGSFLYQCMHQVPGGLETGNPKYFIVDCMRMNQELIPLYATHKFRADRVRW